jgi:hypothetical protein
MSRVSVAVVLIAPVIMIAAFLWIIASLLMMAWPDASFFGVWFAFFCGVRNISAAYNMRGTAMERYSFQTYLAVTPHDALVILLNCRIQSWPFIRAAAHCPFQFILLLTMMPRNLAVSFDSMWKLFSVSVCLGTWMRFLGLRVCGIVFLDMSSSWNFSILNSQLWILAHAETPLGRPMMSHIFLCVSEKSFPISMMVASSTKRRVHSPFLVSGIFSRSVLYSR